MLVAWTDFYASQLPVVQDVHGFVNATECDSLLFSSLIAASGQPIDIGAAADPAKPGRWYRRPTSYSECFAAGESRSTISRDQLLGLYWYMWSADRLDLALDLWNYGVARNWVMGDDAVGGLAHTTMNANMIALLGRLIAALGGPVDMVAMAIPPVWNPDARGYEAHLNVLQILLWGEIHGQIPSWGLATLRAHAARQPRNPLLAASLVRYDGASPAKVEALVAARWPRDRLPNNDDWCSAWVVEVDSGEPGFLPCLDRKLHSGGELLFIRRILSGK